MRIQANEAPVKIDTEGARARQKTRFGDATGYGAMGVEHFAMAAGTDITPLLEGLEETKDLCHAPHWGHLLRGAVTVTYADGTKERTEAGDLFHWPPGHTVRADEDAEFVMFSPEREHTAVMDHVNRRLGA